MSTDRGSGRQRLVIGCPVAHREWIIERWLEHVVNAVRKVDVEFALLFVGDSTDPTFDVVDTFCKEYRVPAYLHTIDEPRTVDERQWNAQRYHRMVELRNTLLGRVREMAPDYFLSLDSDILLHPDSISTLFESVDMYDAVGGKVYMTTLGTHCPSYGRFKRDGSGLLRRNASAVFRVDVIMAIKLMSQAAYNVDYKFDSRGEDIGWSINCREAGLKLGWDGRVVNKHVMRPDLLDTVDNRVGF
jgi:cellulose synthase/poly-beta-1,6-N-acetylglucosamine synthase-like glycosyltransferase